MKNIRFFFFWKYLFFEGKFSVYLNRFVFVMFSVHQALLKRGSNPQKCICKFFPFSVESFSEVGYTTFDRIEREIQAPQNNLPLALPLFYLFIFFFFVLTGVCVKNYFPKYATISAVNPLCNNCARLYWHKEILIHFFNFFYKHFSFCYKTMTNYIL